MFPCLILNDMPHGSNHNDLSTYAAMLDDKITELKTECYSKVKLYTEIKYSIDCMDNDTEQDVLRLKYIHGMTWENISTEMNYTFQHLHKIHARALRNFKRR